MCKLYMAWFMSLQLIPAVDFETINKKSNSKTIAHESREGQLPVHNAAFFQPPIRMIFIRTPIHKDEAYECDI